MHGGIEMRIQAILLAGGRSRRMGTDKAVLSLGGIPLIERLIHELTGVADRIIISTGSTNSKLYSSYGQVTVSDMYEDAGPLAGLHAGLSISDSLWTLVIACDMPFANKGIFRMLMKEAESAESTNKDADQHFGLPLIEAVIPSVNGRLQPLMAVYRRSIMEDLERELRGGRHKVTDWALGLRARYISGEQLADASGLPTELLDYNMNRPSDYEKARAIFGDIQPPI